MFDVAPYGEALKRLIGLAGQEDFILAELSPGGGLGVQYTLDDKVADATDWVRTMSASLEKECGKRGWPAAQAAAGTWPLAGGSGRCVCLYSRRGQVLQ